MLIFVFQYCSASFTQRCKLKLRLYTLTSTNNIALLAAVLLVDREVCVTKRFLCCRSSSSSLRPTIDDRRTTNDNERRTTNDDDDDDDGRIPRRRRRRRRRKSSTTTVSVWSLVYEEECSGNVETWCVRVVFAAADLEVLGILVRWC